MSSSRIAVVALLAAVAAVVAWRACRDGDGDGDGDGTATTASKVDVPSSPPQPATTSARPVTPNSPRLAMPEPAVADVVVPDACAQGTSSKPEWWDCLPKNPSWDAERARYLIERLGTHLDMPLELERIECRARCCRVRITAEEKRAYGEELASSVGLRIGPTDGYLENTVDDDFYLMTCWKPGSIEAFPDRAVERASLLAAAETALAACGKLEGAPASAALVLMLGEGGAIEEIEHTSAAPPAVWACIDAALRASAAFAATPDTMSRSVPLRVSLVSLRR